MPGFRYGSRRLETLTLAFPQLAGSSPGETFRRAAGGCPPAPDVTTDATNQLWRHVWNRYGIKFDKKDFPILLQGSALRKRYHPVKEYFAFRSHGMAWIACPRCCTNISELITRQLTLSWARHGLLPLFAACFTLAVSLITFSFLKVRKAS